MARNRAGWGQLKGGVGSRVGECGGRGVGGRACRIEINSEGSRWEVLSHHFLSLLQRLFSRLGMWFLSRGGRIQNKFINPCVEGRAAEAAGAAVAVAVPL